VAEIKGPPITGAWLTPSRNKHYPTKASTFVGAKIVAGIIVARHLDTADDLFGGPQGSPRTDKMIAAAIQWAAKILQKIDKVFG
jgi:hypothetical protein